MAWRRSGLLLRMLASKVSDMPRELMEVVAKAVKTLPNKVAIAGYTDSARFARPDLRDNWDLSVDRANATRRALVAAGLSDDRIATVEGKADQDPLIKDDPTSPRNRRISIVLLRRIARAIGLPVTQLVHEGAEPVAPMMAVVRVRRSTLRMARPAARASGSGSLCSRINTRPASAK